MSVGNILSLSAAKMGLNPSDAGQRNVLLRFLNEAAFETYIQSDMAGSLMEQYFKVNGNQDIAMPLYVGPIRAVREAYSYIPWSINQLRPRYNQSNWPDTWRNWRLKYKSPLQAAITNESVMNVTVPVVEVDPISVTITGRTPTAQQVSETVIMSALVVPTVNVFLEPIISISKSKVTDYDVAVSDIDGRVLSVIANTELQAWYQIVDVSTMPWLAQSNTANEHWVEVLFKKALIYLSNDGDEFPGQGYDHIISNKMVQIWAQEQGKVDVALAYDELNSRSMGRLQEEANRATQDVISVVANPQDTLLPRLRTSRYWRRGRFSSYGY